MDTQRHWAQYFDQHKHPCFIHRDSTGEILYCNQGFLALYGLEDSVVGSAFQNVVSPSALEAVNALPNWDLQDIFETESYSKELQKHFLVKSSLICNEDTILNQIIPQEKSHSSPFHEVMTRCAEILQDPQQSAEGIHRFTQLLGEFYQAQLAYVYGFHQIDCTIEPLSTWVSEDFTPSFTGTPSVERDSIVRWFQAPSTPTVMIGDKNSENHLLRDIISSFHVENVLFSKIKNCDGEVVGILGVSNRRDTSQCVDLRFLSTIAHFVTSEVSKKYSEETLLQLHDHDLLTGLFNRVGYGQKTEAILQEPPKTLGIISVNVNGLKLVNEEAGIAQGDKLIQNTTNLLKKHFDYQFFRLSGDEFVGIAENQEKDSFQAKVLALHECMRQENNYDFAMGHSWDSGTYDFQKLVQEAEVMMYINKQEYYASSKRACDSVGDNTLSDLLSFLEKEEFMVYLQPQVRLKDGSLHGAEALIRRFDTQNQKMVFPDQFIPLYEQKSVIRHIDMFVVESVCKLIQQWLLEGKHIPISVNLSRVTLQEFGIVETIVEICDRYQVPHNLMVIEVTERVGLIENNVASTLIQDFKKHGFSISLDDFGCAYSNIVTLAQIQVDEVKIDKSLVDEVLNNQKNSVIVESVLSMCNKLENTATLAEGIEDLAQADLLQQFACSLGQGYLYSRPIPVEEFQDKYLKKIKKKEK